TPGRRSPAERTGRIPPGATVSGASLVTAGLPPPDCGTSTVASRIAPGGTVGADGEGPGMPGRYSVRASRIVRLSSSWSYTCRTTMALRGLDESATCRVCCSATGSATQYGPCTLDRPGSTHATPGCTVRVEPARDTCSWVPPGRTPCRAPRLRPSYMTPRA